MTATLAPELEWQMVHIPTVDGQFHQVEAPGPAILKNRGPEEIRMLARSILFLFIDDLQKIVGGAEVAIMLEVSRQRLFQLKEANQLPEPKFTISAGPIWLTRDIVEYGLIRQRQAGRPAKS